MLKRAYRPKRKETEGKISRSDSCSAPEPKVLADVLGLKTPQPARFRPSSRTGSTPRPVPEVSPDGSPAVFPEPGTARRPSRVNPPVDRPEAVIPDPVPIPSRTNVPMLWMRDPFRHPGALEAFRVLKNRLTLIQKKENIRRILFTGAGPGVGVSTTVFNLGLVLSRDLPDQRVLLVDANLKKPVLHTAFGIELNPGLLNYLNGETSLGGVLQPSELPNLDLLAVGSCSETIYSPFDLTRFTQLLAEVRDRYHYVLMDAEPVLQASESRVASAKIDGVVLVAEGQKTRWEVVDAIKQQLQTDGVRLLGAFLNKRCFVIPRWVYRFI